MRGDVALLDRYLRHSDADQDSEELAAWARLRLALLSVEVPASSGREDWKETALDLYRRVQRLEEKVGVGAQAPTEGENHG